MSSGGSKKPCRVVGCRSDDLGRNNSATAGLQLTASDAVEAIELKRLDRPKIFLSAFANFVQQGVASRDRVFHQAKDGIAKPTLFCGSQKTNICIKKYVERIAVHSKCSPVCFLGALVYLQRLAQKDDKHALCSRSVHRLLITGVLIAAKVFDDKLYSNSFYARIGGISIGELNELELEMLKLLDFKAFVSYHELTQMLALLFGVVEGQKGTVEALESRVSCQCRKRGNEGVQSDSEALQPSKLQHDCQSHQSPVLVKAEACTEKTKGNQGSTKKQPAATIALKCHADEGSLPTPEAKTVHVQLAICAGSN